MSTGAALQDRVPVDLAEAERMLGYITAVEDRDTWLQAGMALHAEFGPAAFDVWDRWSMQADNYDARACKASWRGFRARPGGIGLGTLIKLATDGGFRFQVVGADDQAAAAARRAELVRLRAERLRCIEAEQAARVAGAEWAHRAAHETWALAAREGNSPYVRRKGIEQPESVRYLTDDGGVALVVPMIRYDLPRERALVGVQIIHASGAKRFTKGMAKAGAACRLGLVAVDEPIFVTEGWATGMSLRMAMQDGWGARRWPVFVAFDAGNLPLVAEIVHQAHPTSPLVLMADDDHATRVRGLPHNTGRVQAQVAQESVMDAGCRLCVRSHPVFAPTIRRGAGDTDFNDLHRLEGLPAVAAQVRTALECLEELKQYA